MLLNHYTCLIWPKVCRSLVTSNKGGSQSMVEHICWIQMGNLPIWSTCASTRIPCLLFRNWSALVIASCGTILNIIPILIMFFLKTWGKRKTLKILNTNNFLWTNIFWLSSVPPKWKQLSSYCLFSYYVDTTML